MSIVCVSLINGNNLPIMVQSGSNSKPLNLCTQHEQPRNNPADPRPHVKRTLKELIQSRRLAEGKAAITIDFDKRQSDEELQLTPEELARQKDRKEQNRRAAQKCRQKKRQLLQTLLEEEEELLQKRRHLESTYKELNREKEDLLQRIRSNSFCTFEIGDRSKEAQKEEDRGETTQVISEKKDISDGEIVKNLLDNTTKHKNPKHYYIQRYQHDQSSMAARASTQCDSSRETSSSESDSQSSCSIPHSFQNSTVCVKQEKPFSCEHKLKEDSSVTFLTEDSNLPSQQTADTTSGITLGQTLPVDFSRKNVDNLLKGCDLKYGNLPSQIILNDTNEESMSHIDNSQQSTRSNISENMDVCLTDSSQDLASSQEFSSSQELSSSQDLFSSQEFSQKVPHAYYRNQKANIIKDDPVDDSYSSGEDDYDSDALVIDEEVDSRSKLTSKNFATPIFNAIKVTCT